MYKEVERLMAKQGWDPRDRYSPAALAEWAEHPEVHQQMLEINQLSRQLCEENGVSDTMLLPFELREPIDAANDSVLDSLWSDND